MDNKTNKPILAICYDFDRTLTPVEMQAQGFIQKTGLEPETFWKKSNMLAEKNNMDPNLAYTQLMIQESIGKEWLTKEKLREYGSEIKLYDGLDTWFDRVNKYGEEKGIIVEHYIISSGLKEMIEGTSIKDKFKEIYACSFLYDDNGVAIWPTQVVNYTNKTQFLFRIEKGVLDVNDQKVNEKFKEEDLRVPFRNIVYIGDSATDIPCMKLVTCNGGSSIGVYHNDKTNVYKMTKDERITYFAKADYTENSELDKLLKLIIDNTKTNEALISLKQKCLKETCEYEEKYNSEDIRRQDLIIELRNTRSFSRTHTVISEMNKFTNWTKEEKEKIYNIALRNNQVTYILKDEDVRDFMVKLIGDKKKLSPQEHEIQNILKDSKKK